MPEDAPPQKSDQPRFITGGDWSVGLNSPTSLSQVEVLVGLGHGLQRLYEGIFEEGTPEHLAAYVAALEKRKA